MNWTTFLITLTLAYLAYYGLNLLYDLLVARKLPKADSADEVLYFDEDATPQIIEPSDTPAPDIGPATAPQSESPEPEPSAAPPAPPQGLSGKLWSTGAVGIKELFGLAKDNLVEYTGDISYG
ncbi:hypothetical protein [Parapedobacter soli]|uniref:hypothetical protein n=1 Tax=Parapedobacter soli TaxID=416955 RepID=UPI0021C6280B|nr:hypothetical protein [Parapedobacter soli]